MKLFNILLYLTIACLLLTVIHCEEPTTSADEEPDEELEVVVQRALKHYNIDSTNQKVITKEQFRPVFQEVMGKNGDPETDKMVDKMTNSFFEDLSEEIHLHNITDYFDSGKILKAFSGILTDLGINPEDVSKAMAEMSGEGNNEDDFDLAKELGSLFQNEENDVKDTNDEKHNEDL